MLCGRPISSEELNRHAIVYELVRHHAHLSRHHPMAERIAAMAIRFYQLGVRDEEVLIEAVLRSCQKLTAASITAKA
jgi:enoyl-CoA hydratase/carnithine racemase